MEFSLDRSLHRLAQRQTGNAAQQQAIQSAVIRVMSANGDSYAPFEAPTMGLYARAMVKAGISGDEVKVGVYAVDEQVIVDLLREDGLLDLS